MVYLPLDVLFLILDVIKARRQYHDLYRYALACKSLTKPALDPLYQASTMRLRVFQRPSGDKNKEERDVRRCAWMWRSIILSTCKGKTYLPYCEYIRSFDIGSLEVMLNHREFLHSISDEFFARDVAELVQRDYQEDGGMILKLSRTVVSRLGSLIVEKAHKITVLEGADYPQSLKAWTSYLPNLQTLHLENGNSLADNVQESIRAHCPSFKNLTVTRWPSYYDEDDENSEVERFFTGLRPDSLASFRGPYGWFSDIDSGPRFISVFGCHLKSLTSLSLTNLSPETAIELTTLGAFEALEDLDIGGYPPKASGDEITLPVARWLCQCKNLRSLYLEEFLDNVALLSRVLVDPRIRLDSLHVEIKDTTKIHQQAFYESLAFQCSLRMLHIIDVYTVEVPETLVQAVSKLNQLEELEMPGSLSLVQLRTLISSLSMVESFDYFSLYMDDDLWPLFLGLKNLKKLTTDGECEFTARGILNFVSQLGPRNWNFQLRIPRIPLSDKEFAAIEDALRQKGDGTGTKRAKSITTSNRGTYSKAT